jgi:hypothetical protein
MCAYVLRRWVGTGKEHEPKETEREREGATHMHNTTELPQVACQLTRDRAHIDDV